MFRGQTSDKSEIAKLDSALGVDEDIGGLEISMDETAGMKILECPCELIDDELSMDIFEDSLGDHLVQVGLNVLHHHIQILVVLGLDRLLQLDDVRVAQLLHHCHLSVGPLGVCGMLKCIKDLLQTQNLLCLLVLDPPDVSVGSRAHLLQDVVFAGDVRFDACRVFIGHYY